MPTREELLADRAALVAARQALLGGTKVREYWRDGRRVVYQSMTAREITTAISDIDDQLRCLDVEAGTARPRFRALSVRFAGR